MTQGRILWCLRNLDCAQVQRSSAITISKAELEKWELLDAIRGRHLQVHHDGVMQLNEFTIPETRYAVVDYCPDIKPGMFGKLVPGRYEDLAFVPLGDSGQNNSALFSYQSNSWLTDRDYVDYEEVGEDPRVYDQLSFNMRT